jgi:hypothetical protein
MPAERNSAYVSALSFERRTVSADDTSTGTGKSSRADVKGGRS